MHQLVNKTLITRYMSHVNIFPIIVAICFPVCLLDKYFVIFQKLDLILS